MNPLDVLSLGTLGLRVRKARAGLSALGISIGIATMIVVTAIPASSQADLMQQLSALGTNLLQVSPVPDQDPPAQIPAEAASMTARISPVTEVSAVANTHTTLRRNDQLPANQSPDLAVLAAQPGLLPVVGGSLAQGRWLDPGLPTTVLGFEAAARLGITSLGSSPLVVIGEQQFTVVGILDPVSLTPDLDYAALVGWDIAASALAFDGHPSALYIRTDEPQLEAVRSVLPATVAPESPGSVVVSRPSDALAAKRATEENFSVLFLGLAGVALVVGGIGVANTMVISVLERRSEIGLRRALGATRSSIRSQFLTESVVLSGLGGLCGTALGVAATAGYATYHDWPVVIPVESALAGVAGAVAVGVLAGLYPSVRASRLTPTTALAAT
ncbi:ABC transporter permease [Kineosporia babensis]|uniref:ABC transporter permease n=1 Tax=Kineosporia babensis TaxID=499548 RepID=A0A9X1NNA4_9ACTN|nr:ABC transporter permease [Kineosporia babensis]MCD5316218.1 ABC transporter permease [Kineosporia babensis]